MVFFSPRDIKTLEKTTVHFYKPPSAHVPCLRKNRVKDVPALGLVSPGVCQCLWGVQGTGDDLDYAFLEKNTADKVDADPVGGPCEQGTVTKKRHLS